MANRQRWRSLHFAVTLPEIALHVPVYFSRALLEIIHHKFNIILVLWQAVRFQTWSFLQLKAFYIQNTDGDGSVVKLVIEGVHPFSTVSLAQQVIDPLKG